MASSRVGLRIRTFIVFVRGTAARASITGIANARVLPVPVCAVATTSRPSMSGGMACAWTGVGVTNSFLSRLFRNAEQSLSSEKCFINCVRFFLDVDAVFIASPDHWHALMTIMACEAGKDVYVEKPACLTIEEGRAMIRAAERYGRVVQVGSQGRSQPAAYRACSYIRNGQIGTVRKVACWHYASPAGDWTPDSEPPSNLDYDAWIGPARWIPYNSKHTHGLFRWLLDFGGGQIRDRGAHIMSIAQWIMQADEIGPVVIDGRGEPPHDGMYDAADKMNIVYEFKNPDWTLIWAQPGETSAELPARYGAVYHGDKGKLTVTYGDGQNTATEPKAMQYDVPCGGAEVFKSPGHAENLFDCIKSREKPIMHIEAGVRVAHLCILGNLSYALGRRFEWDPVHERITNDDEANRLLGRPGRGAWNL